MANIYYTEEVGKVIDGLLDEMALDAVKDDDLVLEDLEERISEIRTFRKFGAMIIEKMTQQDNAYEARMAAARAGQGATAGG